MKGRFSTFTVLIAGLGRSIRKIKTEEMATFNLKSPHVSCLYYLYKAETLTAKELCDVCDEDKAAVSRSIDYLEKNGYVFCDSTAKKRYKAPLSLTEKGREVGEKVAERIDAVLEEASAGMSEETRKAMYEGLTLVNGNLQKICQKYGG